MIRFRKQIFFFLIFQSFFCAQAKAEETTRIVSLVPNMTDLILAIGAEDQLVGVSDFCKVPPPLNLPKLGGLLNPALESVAALKPKAVLYYHSQKDFGNKINNLKIQSVPVRADSIKDIYDSLAMLGRLTGKKENADALAQKLRTQFRAVQQKAVGLPSPRVIIITSRDTLRLRSLYQGGPDTHMGDLLRLAGGSFAIASSASLTLESLIAADPDVIIDATVSANQIPQARELWNSLSSLSAVKNKQVHFITDPQAGAPGSRMGETAETVFRLIHGPNAVSGENKK